MQQELFFNTPPENAMRTEQPLPGVTLMRGRALAQQSGIITDIRSVVASSPFRFMKTPGGRKMSVSTTCCGDYGWVSDHRGYRYDSVDPLTGAPWPEMPSRFRSLASSAAEAAGFAGFSPDSCLINRYRPGSKMSLHQDRDEQDLSAPIVSLSLGLPATFMFGGAQRADRPLTEILLEHGDVLVFGGEARLLFHGVKPLKEGNHPTLGSQRVNLTFRKARSHA